MPILYRLGQMSLLYKEWMRREVEEKEEEKEIRGSGWGGRDSEGVGRERVGEGSGSWVLSSI